MHSRAQVKHFVHLCEGVDWTGQRRYIPYYLHESSGDADAFTGSVDFYVGGRRISDDCE
jgi:hypothetical protein